VEVDAQVGPRSSEVVDADLADYSAAFPRRIDVVAGAPDRRSAVLHLIRLRLEVCCRGQRRQGRRKRTHGSQGLRPRHPARVSHLTLLRISTCAGLCWHEEKLGLDHRLGSRIMTYADDLVILCRKAGPNKP